MPQGRCSCFLTSASCATCWPAAGPSARAASLSGARAQRHKAFGWFQGDNQVPMTLHTQEGVCTVSNSHMSALPAAPNDACSYSEPCYRRPRAFLRSHVAFRCWQARKAGAAGGHQAQEGRLKARGQLAGEFHTRQLTNSGVSSGAHRFHAMQLAAHPSHLPS